MVNVKRALCTGRIWPGVKKVALSVTIPSVMAAGLVVAPPPEPATAALSGTTTLISKSSNGVIGNFGSFNPSFSADGRYVAFSSDATNLVEGDTNELADIFVRDLVAGTTERVSLSLTGRQGDGASFNPSFSADGRYIVFYSSATNLVEGDTNAFSDVFVRDLAAGTTERVSVSSSGTQGNGESYGGTSLSADGRYIVFSSGATNLVEGDTNRRLDVFVRDLAAGTTERVSVSSSGTQGDEHSFTHGSVISADGRYVSFYSTATNLVEVTPTSPVKSLCATW